MNSYPSSAVAVDPSILASLSSRSIFSLVLDTLPPSVALYVIVTTLAPATSSSSSSSKAAVYVASSSILEGTYVGSSDTILPSASFQPMNLYPSSAVAVDPSNAASSSLTLTVSVSLETDPPSVAI